MKKLLLIGLAVSGLALVAGQRADAQASVGFAGVGISFGFPGGYYAYPTRYNYYPYGYSPAAVLLLFATIFLLLQWHPIPLV